MRIIHLMNVLWISSGCFHVTSFSGNIGAKQAQMTVIYHDQNNNRYTVTSDSIHYRPTHQRESSSGMYSGGIQYSKPLSADRHHKISEMALTLLVNKVGHSDKRIMTTSVLTIVRDTGSDTCILLPSVQRANLENELEKHQ